MEEPRSRERASPLRKRKAPASVTDLHAWVDLRIDELIHLADGLLEGDLSLTGNSALRVMQAAEALVVTRRQGQRVYQAGIEQLRVVGLDGIGESESQSMPELRARSDVVAEGYRALILRLNPRAVIGDLL